MDPSAMNPFWGAQTSYLNFCEEDYVVTRYIAEFINALSSFTYIVYGLYGLRKLRHEQQFGTRSIPYFGLIGVGVCSGSYHMTLKYYTQMSDELSMHLLTTPLVYRLLVFRKSLEYTKRVGIILLLTFTVVMVVHMVLDEFLLHATTFALAVLVIVVKLTKIIPQQIPDLDIRKKLRSITQFGLFSFIFGYMVWLIDEFACRYLTDIRHSVGLPLAFLFELHGWWHIFTAIGGYVAVEAVDLITSGAVHEDPTEDLAWPVPGVMGLIRATTETKRQN